MRILLDECVDWRLSRSIQGHEVVSVQQAGWAGLPDESILERAAASFDVLITVDRNLTVQQQISRYDLGVVVLSAPSNRLADLLVLVPDLLLALDWTRPCEAQVIKRRPSE